MFRRNMPGIRRLKAYPQIWAVLPNTANLQLQHPIAAMAQTILRLPLLSVLSITQIRGLEHLLVLTVTPDLRRIGILSQKIGTKTILTQTIVVHKTMQMQKKHRRVESDWRRRGCTIRLQRWRIPIGWKKTLTTKTIQIKILYFFAPI